MKTFPYSITLRGNHSTLIRQRCEVNIHKIYCVHLTFYTVTFRLALARRSKFSDTARNPAKQRSISSAVLRSLMSVGNATDKAE